MTALCFMLGIACYFDYRKGKIPNVLLLIMLITGCGIWMLRGGISEMIFSLSAGILVVLLLYPLYRIGAMGAADVKLYGICAGYLPRDKFVFFLFVSLLIAAVVSPIKMVKECNAIERMEYLCEYILDVVREGKFFLYIENEKEKRSAGICLAGPILGSLLLYLGGAY